MLRGKVRYLPNQYNYLSWMRPRNDGGMWHQTNANPMAYCLSHVREELAIAHMSAGSIPSRITSDRHETIDSYWMALRSVVTTNANEEQRQIPSFETYKTNLVQQA